MPAMLPDDAMIAPTSAAIWMKWARLAVVFAFSAAILAYVILSRHWPLIWDMQVMHYVSFLIDKGWAPYREIGDMNMPGSYLFEGWALHLFGSSDVGWRLYDFSLCAVLLASMVCIARRYDWLAGFVAGATFIMVHASEGAINAGQREQEIAVLLLMGTAFCFESVRQRRPWLMLPFGLATAMASTIKPTFILVGPAILILALVHLRREKIRSLAYLLWTLSGFVVATFIVMRFLLVHDSLRALIYDLTKVIPHYAGVNQATWGFLLGFILPRTIFVFVGIAVVVALLDRNCFNWEIAAILIGVFFGLLSYIGQHKGFAQHRYPELAFVLLWASLQIFASLGGRRRPAQYLAYAALLVAVFINIPRSLAGVRRQLPYDNYSHYLEQDLRAIGPDALQHHVQCLDVIDGCLTALYHLKIEQSNGATGDLALFLTAPSWSTDQARIHFWEDIQKNEPTVYVLSNFQFGLERNFDRIDLWPVFAAYFRQNYELVEERQFSTDPPTATPNANPKEPAYRIYIRKGSPLLAAARRRESTTP